MKNKDLNIVDIRSVGRGKYTLFVRWEILSENASAILFAKEDVEKALTSATRKCIAAIVAKPKAKAHKTKKAAAKALPPEKKEPENKASAKKTRKRYTPEQKTEVIDFMKENPGRGNMVRASDKFGVSAPMIAKWMEKFAAEKPAPQHHPEDFLEE